MSLVSFQPGMQDDEVFALLARHNIPRHSVQPTPIDGLWRLDSKAASTAWSLLMADLATEASVEFVSPARVDAHGRLIGIASALRFAALDDSAPEAIIDSARLAGAGQLEADLDAAGPGLGYVLQFESKNRAALVDSAQQLAGQPGVLWAAAQEFTVPDGLVYIVREQPTEVVRYADGSRAKLPTQDRWRLMCGSRPMEFSDFRSLVNQLRIAPPAVPNAAAVAQAQGGSPFNVVFVTSGLPAGAAAAIAAVEAYLEALIFDPITVTINVSFAPMGGGVLGATSSSYTSDSYTDVRAGLEAGMDFDDSIQLDLPMGASFPVRYNGNSDTVTNEAVVFVTRANYKATIGNTAGNAGSMTFNSNFSWDYTPPSILGGAFCFQSVLAHEVGHALGFVSGADFRFNDSELLDLYRFQRSDGAFNYNPDTLADFNVTPRMVDQDAPGTNNDVVVDIISAEHRMSDGNPSQASHFAEGIGFIMDPTLSGGQTFYPEFYRVGDQDMFDAIGYDIFDGIGPLLTPTADPQGSHMGKNRSFAFVIPGDPGQDTAIRVKLASLHHPAGPPNAPDFTALEGQIRYLNSFRDGADNPVFDCPDSPAFGTTYTCAVLGCEPEYRDWVAAFDGDPVHVFGSAVVPSSEYAITHLAATCAGNEAACTDMWAELFVTTERWGNVDNTPALSAPNAVDLGLIVSKVKDVAGALIEPRAQLQPGTPDPLGDSLSALDIARGVDSVQGDPYPFTIDSCP